MKITKTDGKFEAVIGEEPRLNDMAEVSDAQAVREEKQEALIEFLERLDSDLPGNLYDAIVDMADRVVKSAQESAGDRDNAMKLAFPSGKVTLTITLDSSSLKAPQIGAKGELKRAFGLELMGTKAPMLNLWSDGSGGLKFSDPDQPELNL